MLLALILTFYGLLGSGTFVWLMGIREPIKHAPPAPKIAVALDSIPMITHDYVGYV